MTESESILNRVRQTYSELESYSDVGTVFLHGLGDRITEFKTYFVRPEKVRFEWQTRFTEPDKVHHSLKATGVSHGTVWSDGANSYCSVYGQKREEKDLSFAIAAGTGEASISVTILNLLLSTSLESGFCRYWTAKLEAEGFAPPEESETSKNEKFVPWHEMHDISLADKEEVNGILCHHLIGTTDEENDTEAWIDKDTFLVRRLRVRSVTPGDFAEGVLRSATEMAEKAGLPLSQIAPFVDALPGTICHQYNYRQISINKRLANGWFNSESGAR